jgi:23S rRNA pseudouridine1911/1915/1917 synthase
LHNQPSRSLPDPQILLETDRILAVCKPGGLLTQAPSGIDSMEVRIRRYLGETRGRAGKVYLGVPHRLDRPASGVLVFAKDKSAARCLAEQFQRRQVVKVYRVLVTGRVRPERGTWQDWMRKVPGEARSEICEGSCGGAQAAILHYQCLASGERDSLLEVRLDTGRSHQIRVQSACRGHPVLGDELYGSRVFFGPRTEDPRSRWIALHAWRLEVLDPDSQKPLTIEAAPPSDWPVQRGS